MIKDFGHDLLNAEARALVYLASPLRPPADAGADPLFVELTDPHPANGSSVDRRAACLYHRKHCRRFSQVQAGRLKGNDGSDRRPSLMQAVAVPATVSGESAPESH